MAHGVQNSVEMDVYTTFGTIFSGTLRARDFRLSRKFVFLLFTGKIDIRGTLNFEIRRMNNTIIIITNIIVIIQ